MSIFDNPEPMLNVKRKVKVDKKAQAKARNRERVRIKLKTDPELRKKYTASSKKWIENNRKLHSQMVMESRKKRREKSKRFASFCRRRHGLKEAKARGYSKTCSKCGKEYANTMFDALHHENRKYIKNKRTTERRPYCFYCRREMNKSYYQRNKEKWKKYNPRYKGYDLDT